MSSTQRGATSTPLEFVKAACCLHPPLLPSLRRNPLYEFAVWPPLLGDGCKPSGGLQPQNWDPQEKVKKEGLTKKLGVMERMPGVLQPPRSSLPLLAASLPCTCPVQMQ